MTTNQTNPKVERPPGAWRPHRPGFPPDAARLPRPTPLRVYTDLEGAGFGRPSFLVLPWVPGVSAGPLVDSFAEDYQQIVTLTDLDSCDLAMLPFDATVLLPQRFAEADEGARRFAEGFVERVSGRGCVVAALAAGDSTAPLRPRFDFVLRHSIDGRRRGDHEYCLPGWFDAAQTADPAAAVTPRARADRPVVSFCGQAATPGVHLARRVRQRLLNLKYGHHHGHDAVDPLLLRRRAMDALARSRDVACLFVVRDQFYAGLDDMARAREEYLASVRESDYVLCVRGHGNYSFRFFDALSMGRVPVLVDTDCVLPFDFMLNYRDFLPVVSADAIGDLPRVIAEHYHGFDRDGWAEYQHALRRFYLDWLSPVGFFSKLRLHPGMPAAGAAT